MKIQPGQIIPINNKFWPARSENIVQAMVMKQVEGFYEMCPVHANIEAAGFFDLIVRGSTITSGIDMVIMCRDSVTFPELALNKEKDEFDMGPILTQEEGRKIIADVNTVLTHHDSKEAYSVLRGTPLPANSREKELAETIRSEWKAFRLTAMCEAVKARQADIPRYVNIREFLDWAARIIDNLLQPFQTFEAGGAMRPAFSAANLKSTADEDEKINKLKQNLKEHIKSDTDKKKKLQKLLTNDDPADLLEATLRIYEKRNLDDI